MIFPGYIMNPLIDVIADIESGGDPNAIGDNGHAFGILQIWQEDLDDYNKWNGSAYELMQLLGNETLSRFIFKDYMEHYCTEARLGRAPTVSDAARIWNGGPNGWKKKATLPYLERFVEAAKRHNFNV